MKDDSGISRRPMSDRVRQVLLDRILDGTYPPGQRLIELDLARELDTSQAPVREALRELKALRLVTVEPYRGTRVREVSEREMRGALQVRAVLEQFAAELAASHPGGRLAELEAEIEGMRDAAGDGDVERFARHDLGFHRIIVEESENDTLLRTWESLGVEARIRILLARTGIDLATVADAHRPILDALVAGDGRTAGNLLRSHPESVYWPR